MGNAPFYYSEDMMCYDMGPRHPLRPRRLKMTVDLMESCGLFASALERRTPSPVEWDEAAAVHSVEYLEAVRRLDGGEPFRGMQGYGFGGGDNPIFPGIFQSSLGYTGASANAAQAVVEGAGLAFNIAGGLHHAHYDRAAGFCVLNDCAVALRRLRTKFARVAYVDIDVHHGDGVQELFYEDPTVLTISLHESGQSLFPGTGFTAETGEGAGKGFSVNLPFAPYTTDDIWVSAWREAALPLLEAFNPEAIVLQMGTDTHELDPLAHLSLTAQGWLEAVKDVKRLGRPIVAVGGGGYNLSTVPRMWTLAAAALSETEIPDALPDSYAFRSELPGYLSDQTMPKVSARQTAMAAEFAADSVQELKTLLFPRYGLCSS